MQKGDRPFFDYLGNEEESVTHARAIGHQRGATLRRGHFGDDVVSQAQGNVRHCAERVGEGFDAPGVDRLQLLDQTENLVEISLCLGLLAGRELQPGQPGDAGDFLFCQCHE